MSNTNGIIYKFGDYCLVPAKSIVRSHRSMDAIFEALYETNDIMFRERLVECIKRYLNRIDICIKKIEGLLQTLPFVADHPNDIVDIKELEKNKN